MSWSLPEILRATGGDLVEWGAGPFGGVSTDSRGEVAGRLFFALSGSNHDGHDFVPDAVAGGATGVVVSRDLPPAPGVAWIRVGEVLRALGDLAAWRRAQVESRTVAVTGSNGKTTTKEMIAAILEAAGGRVAKSRGTENNLVGLPLTLLRLRGDEDFTVLEMGMNHSGEIWRLAEIARPEIGVITNVGPAHLEGLGTLENVAAAKAELALSLPASGCLVVNAADRWLRAIAGGFPGRAILAGEGPVRLFGVEPLPGGGQKVSLEIDGRRVSARLRAIGEHNAANAVLAAATAHALGALPDAIVAGLERFEPAPMRLRLVELAGGARVLNDAYNANPASMVAAIQALAAEPGRRRIAVLGEMLELGTESARYHREVGEAAARSGVDLFLAVGGQAPEMALGARGAGLPADRILTCSSAEEAASALAAGLREGDVVLVKGSRRSRMEEVVERLTRLHPRPA